MALQRVLSRMERNFADFSGLEGTTKEELTKSVQFFGGGEERKERGKL